MNYFHKKADGMDFFFILLNKHYYYIFFKHLIELISLLDQPLHGNFFSFQILHIGTWVIFTIIIHCRIFTAVLTWFFTEVRLTASLLDSSEYST